MTSSVEPFYRSSNGDCWSLVGRSDGSVVVRHKANAPAGGTITDVGLAAFLACEGEGPEHQILASLASTMPDFQFLPRRSTVATPEALHVNAGQLRAARALLGWNVEKAASEAEINVELVKAMERGARSASRKDDERRLIRAFERGGIAFISDGAVSTGGSGIRLIGAGTSEAGEGEAHDNDANDKAEASEAQVVSQ